MKNAGPSFWYERVNEALGACPRRLAALAALSPMMPVRMNFRALLELEINGVSRLGFPANRAKARAILAGEPIDSILKGPKVCEFFRSLCLRRGSVCVDRHMLRWAGCGQTWSVRNVRHAQDEVRQVAREWGCETYQAQAGIWQALVSADSAEYPITIYQEEENRVRSGG